MPQKRRRASDSIHNTVVVVAADGTRLRGSIAAVGRGTDPRWMILDDKGEQFVGPVAHDRSLEGAQRVIAEWWTDRAKTDQARGASD